MCWSCLAFSVARCAGQVGKRAQRRFWGALMSLLRGLRAAVGFLGAQGRGMDPYGPACSNTCQGQISASSPASNPPSNPVSDSRAHAGELLVNGRLGSVNVLPPEAARALTLLMEMAREAGELARSGVSVLGLRPRALLGAAI